MFPKLEPFGIGGAGRGHDFDSDITIQLRLASAIDLTHTIATNQRINLVAANQLIPFKVTPVYRCFIDKEVLRFVQQCLFI